MVYYSFIQEQQSDPELIEHKAIKKTEKPLVAFGKLVKPQESINLGTRN